MSGFPIVAAPSAARDTVLGNLPAGTHLRFRDAMFPELWAAALDHSVDPVGVVAQAGKETGWGNYPGKVRPEFYNTCGLKVRHQNLFPGVTTDDEPLAHQMFPNWQVGAVAHVQHLVRYTGGTVTGMVVDPRYTYVTAPFVATWAQLGGRWAPSTSYGTEIEMTMTNLRAE